MKNKIYDEFLLNHELAPCPPFSIVNPNYIEYVNENKNLRLVRKNLNGSIDVLDKK